MAKTEDDSVRILLIEDNEAYASDVVYALAELGAEVTVAKSRDSALRALEEPAFDLIVCDLDIPAADGGLDSDSAHGDAVRARVESQMPGTPLIVHSAYGTIPYLQEMIKGARTEDIYGDGKKKSLVKFINKDETTELVEEVALVMREFRTLDDIEIVPSLGGGLARERHEARALSIFARRCQGRRIDVTHLKGGLSSAKVLRVLVRDDHGATKAAVVAKVGDLSAIRDEAGRFHRFVSPLLGFGRFPNLADTVVSGAGSVGAVFYSVAEEHDRSLFAVLEAEQGQADRLVIGIRDIVRRWEERAPTRSLTLGDVRRMHVRDDQLRGDVMAATGTMEGRTVQVRTAVQHGDLHGENLLFDRDSNAALIDFGNVCDSLSGYDAVTLELSLIFHPEGRRRCGGWPTEAEARQWADIDAYTANCPYPTFVRQCRTWANETAAGPRAVLAAAYAHVAKQFLYPDTPKPVASALLQGFQEAWG